MVLLRFFGFVIFCQICVSLLVLLPPSGVIIWVLLICLLIRSFMLVQSMLRSIITLFVIEWLKKRFKFASSHPKINQSMCLQSPLLPRFFLLYVPSFTWITHPQLELVYYRMCCKIGKYYVSSCIALSCVIGYTIPFVQCPTYINSRGAALIIVLTLKEKKIFFHPQQFVREATVFLL